MFVLGCAWRCGSTLLQRYLNSTGRVFIWGEHAGLLAGMPRAFADMWTMRDMGRRQLQELRHSPSAAWIANVSPDIEAFLLPALRGFLVAAYAPATRERGIARWGFKEVRYDAAMAKLLLSLFPAGRVVFLVRHPAGVLASGATMEWRSTGGAAESTIDQWQRACASFLNLTDPRVLQLRYEDLTGDPAAATRSLSEHLGIAAERFSADVLAVRVRGSRQEPSLGAEERAVLARPAVIDLAAAYGYRISA
ncbi:MAG: sulfotransferase [Alphaproteobacteria bacterium]|nr:sulfotransferase [Alphaproteobacteria bacterium]